MRRATHLQRGENGACASIGESYVMGRSCGAAPLGAVLGRTLHQAYVIVRSLTNEDPLPTLSVEETPSQI